MTHRRRRRPAFAIPSDAPISALNTTPLIDVMLVLLIMFIVTIPLATHGIELDLPTGIGNPVEEPHRLEMDRAGRLAFDGAPIAPAALAPRLRTMIAADRNSVLHFRTAGQARYEDFDRTLAIVKGAGVERLGFIGNEGFVAALPSS
jgi:biopolymer transport protein ExbD